ncbi:peptide/nickel transport system substrate-binding protein [Methanobrevibacter gottschalkii DSM 11977]|uniref:Peptide/nickel transport system substrate-binding protein n=1 Tax=Methanobrevibacter gottschalkii DSM 11977 TaxID=1122229 RepID=A0A3N5B2L3_9EURY|nr:ABC transporter substrate-binding protein [Methanobrevibacter gottschalkii]RPF51523.1 peptide/nickel transport system substrate-binding protein [Methanobrevibacter gottschalkii DSM 11977]
MEQKYIIGIIAVILIAIVGGAILIGGPSTERADNELIVAAYSHGGEPEAGFDPILGWNYYSEPLIQSTLLKMTRGMEYENDLAKSWEANSDFTEYTVKIRDDVKFTDNTTLDAEDVAFTYNEAKKSGASLDLSSMENATAVDKQTIKFELNRPDSTFVDKFAYIGIVPSDSYNNETYGANPIGSGPFKFVQWDKGQQVILEKNPDYYGKEIKFDKLTILFEQNEAAFNAAKNKEVDIAAVPLSYANETVDGYNMHLMDTIDVRGLSLPVQNNTGKLSEDGNPIGNNITADKSIREALNYGVNRTAICKGALNGIGVPNYDGIAHLLPWANNESAIDDGDVDKAKDILKKGGWKDTDGDGIVEKDGKKASINVYYSSNAPERQAIAVTIAEEAKEFGIEVNATGSNWDEMDKIKNTDPVVWGFGSTDPSTMWSEYYSDQATVGYNNPALINNSAVDKHIDNAMKSDRESSYAEWSAVSWDGQTGISPKGDAAWLWVGEIKYGYFVDESLDISNNTELIQPHGGDIFGNIYDWSRVSSIEK